MKSTPAFALKEVDTASYRISFYVRYGHEQKF